MEIIYYATLHRGLEIYVSISHGKDAALEEEPSLRSETDRDQNYALAYSDWKSGR